MDNSNKAEILSAILSKIDKVDFQKECNLDGKAKNQKHEIVTTIEIVKSVANEGNYGISAKSDKAYIFNGCYWILISIEELADFLGEAALKIGIDKYDSKYYLMRDKLVNQFYSSAQINNNKNDKILINLLNGTYEFGKVSSLRAFKKEDFLTYQLPFKFDELAECILFEKYLNRVLPNESSQAILAEYIGSVFVRNRTLKTEQSLFLYGNGFNGKSVFFEIILALLGRENVSSYSLNSLTNENGYFRMMIEDKLLNFCSELSSRQDNAVFKQLSSGEPIEARLPNKNPKIIENYAKLAFNCNQLPRQTENTNAFFRRLKIIPFNVQIPEIERDTQLTEKIIENELSGVFNWILLGLERLLKNQRFTKSNEVDELLENYRKESDSILLFLEASRYIKSIDSSISLKSLYEEYSNYCSENGYFKLSNKNFSERLKNNQIRFERKNTGFVYFLKNN